MHYPIAVNLDKIGVKKIYCSYHRLFDAYTLMFSICLILWEKPYPNILRSAFTSLIALV
jgi:hypothetical protein